MKLTINTNQSRTALRDILRVQHAHQCRGIQIDLNGGHFATAIAKCQDNFVNLVE